MDAARKDQEERCGRDRAEVRGHDEEDDADAKHAGEPELVAGGTASRISAGSVSM